HRSSVVVIGRRSLVVGLWSSVVGHRSSVIGRPMARSLFCAFVQVANQLAHLGDQFFGVAYQFVALLLRNEFSSMREQKLRLEFVVRAPRLANILTVL